MSPSATVDVQPNVQPKASGRNRLSAIFSMASPTKLIDAGKYSGSSPRAYYLKKKRSAGHLRHVGANSAVKTELGDDTEISPSSYHLPSVLGTAASVTANSSVVSFPGSHTQPVSSSLHTANPDLDFSASNLSLTSDRAKSPPPTAASSSVVSDGLEKMRLIKKARKLSTIFGDERAAAEDEVCPGLGEASTSEDARHKLVPHTVDGLKKRLRRSSTFGELPSPRSASSSQPRELHRMRSLIIRPTFSNLSISKSPKSSTFPTSDGPANASTSTPASVPPSVEPLHETDGEHLDSPTSSKFPAHLNLELRSTTPLQKKSPASLRKAKGKRRLSLDLSTIKHGQPISSPMSDSFATGDTESSGEPRRGLKRSRSLWGLKKDGQSSRTDPEAHPNPLLEERDRIIRDLKEGRPIAVPMTEKQRFINVKRARKMAQLFGSEPPPSLYTITQVDGRYADDDVARLSPISEVGKRTSVASTLISITPTDFTPMTPSHSPRERRRPHSIASSIVSVIPSPGLTPYDSQPGDTPESSMPPLTPPPFSTCVPLSRPSSSHSRHTARSSSESEIMNVSASRFRRLRAAKLSRFFGVDPHNLGGSLHPAEATPMAASSSLHPDSAYQSRQSMERIEPNRGVTPPPARPQDVDVKVVRRPSRFHWGGHDDPKEDVDMDDVIGKLRRLKAN